MLSKQIIRATARGGCYGQVEIKLRASGVKAKQVRAASYRATQQPEDLIKRLRKPPDFFGEIVEAVKHDLKQLQSIEGNANLRKLLTVDERESLRDTIFANMGFSKPVSSNFLKSDCGLPQMGASIYSHQWSGLVNYILQKKGIDPASASHDDLRKAVNLVTYYRSPLLIEEMKRLGYDKEVFNEVAAKAFFLQYWSGDKGSDPLVFNPMVRNFYPNNKHITNGCGDLGRDQEFQGAKLWAMAHEGVDAPLTVINAGDTLAFTDGAMSCLQHVMEASERGFKMPIIFMINSNNSSISTRLSGDYGDALKDAEEGVKKIQDRLANWGPNLGKGFTVKAGDVVAGVQAMRDAVDQVLETGKPTYVISAYPFRPLGHASDGSPASDELLVTQFDTFVDTLVSQIAATAEPGTAGADIAQALEDATGSIDKHVGIALQGNKVLTRREAYELSVPGIETVEKDPGHIIDVPAGYLLGKGVKAFAGMGADIYAASIDKLFNECEASGREARYIHQENHKPSKRDTRGGVYGELTKISEHHLLTKFVNILPNEAQVAQLGGGFRVALPKDNVVIVKGPHTLFNEHAKSYLKYCAYRHCDTKEKAGLVYLMDGYNIANDEKETVVNPETGAEEVREFTLARVGEHHNSPYYSGYLADPNTVCCAPVDMNLFANMLPEMVNLQGMGRHVNTFLPTKTFGFLHPAFSKGDIPESRGITQQDVLRVSFSGRETNNGKNLVVVTYGPDSRWIAQTLNDQKVESTLFILNYLQPANSLIAYLDDQARAGIPTEVVAVDPNPDSAVLSPIMNNIRHAIGYSDAVHFSNCATEVAAFVPWGYGGTILNAGDLTRVLGMRGIIDSQGSEASAVVRAAPAAVAQKAAAAPSGGAKAGGEEIVKAPMDGENVVVTFRVKVGDQVQAEDVVAEIESDKANIEVVAPTSGTITKLFVKESTEMNVTMDTEICSIASEASGAPAAAASVGGALEVVNAPMDGENVVVTFRVKVGDQVQAEDVVAEIESDKANIEVVAPTAGTVTKLFVAEATEMNVTMDTQILSITGGAAAAAPEAAAAPPAKKGLRKAFDKAAPAAAPAKAAPVRAAAASAEEVVPLSRVQVAMVDNMTVKVGDTKSFTVGQGVDFTSVRNLAKHYGVSPTTALLKLLADSVQSLSLNKKLSTDLKSMRTFNNTADIGVAVEVDGQLRVAVVRDAGNKSPADIAADLESFRLKGSKLSKEDQDLSTVSYVISSLGKTAPEWAYATLPRGITGILAIGRMQDGKSNFVFTLCHATLTGSEGANLLGDVVRRAEMR